MARRVGSYLPVRWNLQIPNALLTGLLTGIRGILSCVPTARFLGNVLFLPGLGLYGLFAFPDFRTFPETRPPKT